MLTSVLNTFTYLGGSPFDKDGKDTYQLAGWAKSAVLTGMTLIRTHGDVDTVRCDFYDRPYSSDARLLYSVTTGMCVQRSFDPPVTLEGVTFDRIFLRLVALDGFQQNHVQVVFRGESLESDILNR